MRRPLRWLGRGLLVAIALVLVWQLWFLGHVVWWSQFDPGSTSFMRLRLSEMHET